MSVVDLTKEFERGYAQAERTIIKYLYRLSLTADTRPANVAVIQDRSAEWLATAADDIRNGAHLTSV